MLLLMVVSAIAVDWWRERPDVTLPKVQLDEFDAPNIEIRP